MGSLSNQNPWGSYDTYKDCRQGLCSLDCPQWCYVLTPPPPYFPGDTQDDDSGIDFSPLIIAIIGILASALLLICYYTIISKYCKRRGNRNTSQGLNDYHTNSETWQSASSGLDEALIKSITVCKYKKGDGLVEGSDCSVCLSEFQENENLRLLPKCNHAFHIPCIDTWLKSNSSCPLCRSNLATQNSLPPQPQDAAQEAQQHPNGNISVHEYQHRNDTVLVIQDVVVQETVVSILEDVHIKTPNHPIRRSISLNSFSQDRMSIADILHACDDDEDIQVENPHVSIGIESSRHAGEEQDKIDDRKGVLHFVRNPSAIKRSISTGRFMFTRYGKERNHTIPNREQNLTV